MINNNTFEIDFQSSLLFFASELQKSIQEKLTNNNVEIDSLFHFYNIKISSFISSFFSFLNVNLREKGVNIFDLEQEFFKFQKLDRIFQFFEKYKTNIQKSPLSNISNISSLSESKCGETLITPLPHRLEKNKISSGRDWKITPILTDPEDKSSSSSLSKVIYKTPINCDIQTIHKTNETLIKNLNNPFSSHQKIIDHQKSNSLPILNSFHKSDQRIEENSKKFEPFNSSQKSDTRNDSNIIPSPDHNNTYPFSNNFGNSNNIDNCLFKIFDDCLKSIGKENLIKIDEKKENSVLNLFSSLAKTSHNKLSKLVINLEKMTMKKFFLRMKKNFRSERNKTLLRRTFSNDYFIKNKENIKVIYGAAKLNPVKQNIINTIIGKNQKENLAENIVFKSMDGIRKKIL